MESGAEIGTSEGIFRDTNAPSQVLIVAFGGLAMGIAAVPPFEFFRMLEKQGPIKKLFVRDHHQSWYHRGVRDLADDIEGVADGLRRIVTEVGAAKVVMLGTSAGGYAALLFGRLLEVTEVHAFGPQTFISPELRQHYGDDRWEGKLSPLLSSDSYQREYGDLNELFNRTRVSNTHFVVHYCEGDALDASHAKHLDPQPGLELRGYEEGHHNVAQYLHAAGELQPLMRRIVSLDSAPMGDPRRANT